MPADDIYSLIDNVAGTALIIWGLAVMINKSLIKSFAEAFSNPEKNQALASFIAAVFLILGLTVIYAHNDWYWSSPTIITTLLGWVITIKAALWLMIPKALINNLVKKAMPLISSNAFRFIYGALIAVLGGLLIARYYYV